MRDKIGKEPINLFDDEKEEARNNKSAVLSFFLIMFPTVLIVLIGMLYQDGWWIMIALAFYQLVMLKQFIDKYYNPLE